MNNCVRKLFFKCVFIQESFDAPCDNRLFQNLVDIGSAMNVHGEHLLHECLELATEVCWQGSVLTSNDLQCEKMQIHALKGWFKRTQFIEHHTQGPNVTLKRIGAALNDLWGKVIRCAHH